MERRLNGLKPENVFYWFEEISRIPRGSGNEKRISDYLAAFARERNLSVIQDQSLNIFIEKPASAGYENRPKVILQGHMDMVCVKDNGVEHDFYRDPIELIIDGDFLTANGTTLGADDGTALALCLAILDDNTIPHPALQVVFTTGEEIGMLGAKAMDAANMNGDYLIGLDYSQDSNILVSCAGSSSNYFLIQAEKTSTNGLAALQLEISGLASGHSGNEIIRGRANANLLLGEILTVLQKEAPLRLASVSGGTKKNVIPETAHTVICCPKEKAETLCRIVGELETVLRQEYRETDPGIQILCKKTDCPNTAYMAADTEKLSRFLILVPNGLQNYMDAARTRTKSSANLGMLYETDSGIEMLSMVRSNSEYQHDRILERMEQLAAVCGLSWRSMGRSPVWEYAPDSNLTAQVQSIWEKLSGKRPEINIIHAGVETCIFIGKFREQGRPLSAINLGVRNYDVHTSRERMEIASMKRTYELLLALLRDLQ